jgi:vacuolar-type H+-ATPase subunit E/Vma4
MGGAPRVGLDAVREALIAEATADAEQLIEQADDWAAAQVALAEATAEAFVDRARAEGEAAAAREAASELAHARRRARALVLRAQRTVYDEARQEARDGVQRLRTEPLYRDLLARLATYARERLGPEADLQLDPPEGGVVAHLGNRRLDLTLPTLVDRCLGRHACELERLWT